MCQACPYQKGERALPGNLQSSKIVFLPFTIVIVNVMFLTGRPKNRWWNCVQILIDAILRSGKRVKKNRTDCEKGIEGAEGRVGL